MPTVVNIKDIWIITELLLLEVNNESEKILGLWVL